MRKKVKWFSGTLFVSMIILAFSGPAVFAEVGVTDTSVLVGCSNSFSGPLVFPGTQLVNYGLELYIKHVNDQGGVHGRKILTKYYDDGYKPQNAVANTKKLVEHDKVFAILSSQGTSPVMATVKYLTESKVPLLFPFQGVPISGKRTIFTSFVPYPTQSEIVVGWLVSEIGFKRIGLLYQDDKYGYTFRDPAKKLLKKMGLDLVAAESYKRRAVDLSAQITKLRKANLEALLLVATPRPGAAALKQAHKVGWKETKLISSGPLTDEKFIILSGGAGEGVWGLSLWPDPVHSMAPAVVEYREMLKKFAPKNPPNRYSLYGYFYAKLFVEGLKRTGRNLTRENYIKALEGIKNWENGIVPPVSFSKTDHLAQDSGFMVAVRDNVFKPISGWLGIKDGKLVESPL